LSSIILLRWQVHTTDPRSFLDVPKEAEYVFAEIVVPIIEFVHVALQAFIRHARWQQ